MFIFDLGLFSSVPAMLSKQTLFLAPYKIKTKQNKAVTMLIQIPKSRRNLRGLSLWKPAQIAFRCHWRQPCNQAAMPSDSHATRQHTSFQRIKRLLQDSHKVCSHATEHPTSSKQMHSGHRHTHTHTHTGILTLPLCGSHDALAFCRRRSDLMNPVVKTQCRQ